MSFSSEQKTILMNLKHIISPILKHKQKWIRFSIFVFFFCSISIYIANRVIIQQTKDYLYDSVEKIPYNKVGLVLGTSKYLRGGGINPYFLYRIEATVSLYNAGKIKYILVSGDNSTKAYDEPTDFKNALIEKGIPSEVIFLDYAGFRTLDSVVRAKEIFSQTQLTIISQEFHNQRAVFIAQKKGISAVGFNAKNVSSEKHLKVQLREYFAKLKVFIDIYTDVSPKFLGEKVIIP